MTKFSIQSLTSFRSSFVFCCLVVLSLHRSSSSVNGIIRNGEINIGAIFHQSSDYNPSQQGFEDGVRYVNEKILKGISLNPIIKYVKEDDSFDALNQACDLIGRNGVWAIFSGQSVAINWIIPSIANNLCIPNIQSIWDYSTSRKVFRSELRNNYSLNLYPDASLLSQAFKDWTEASELKTLTIIYERKEDLIYIKDLLELNSPLQNNIRVFIREHHVDNSDFKKLLKDSKNKNGDNFILSIPIYKVIELLKQAQELNLITEYNKYFITNLDAYKLSYDFLGDRNKNITTLSLVNLELPKDELMAKLIRDYRHEEALMFDAVVMFAKSLDQLKTSAAMLKPPAVSCKDSYRSCWEYGSTIMTHIKNTIHHGLTGPIIFDQNGQRVNFTLRILSAQQVDTSFNQTGIWTVDRKIEIARTRREEVEEDILKMLKNRKEPLKVVAINTRPYVFNNPNPAEEGAALADFVNPKRNFTGFCVELMDELQARLGFEYEIQILNTSTSKDLLDAVKHQRADIAISDITITRDRQSEVDFTMPFVNLGIAILFSKSTAETKSLFSFMEPFNLQVWMLLLTAITAVSLLLYIISRISPYEWVSGHPCEDEPEQMENQFSLGNAIWFVMGSIMQQGSDLAPRALSTRTLANFWAFFTLIIVSSYTANLAAFLTLSGLEIEIKSVEDLAKQTKVKYGLSYDGSTHKFFKNSQHSTYQRMYSYMESVEKEEKVYTKGNEEGVRRVLKGNFAFLMESTTMEFYTNQHCNLTQIGDLLDRKGYGIVLKQGNPYTSLFSAIILKLQEEQFLAKLRTKWLNQYPATLRHIRTPWLSECPTLPEQSSGAKEMDIQDVGGVFILLLSGLFIGGIFVVLEFVWKAKKIPRHERKHVFKLLLKELFRILKLGGGRTTDNILLLRQSSSIPNSLGGPGGTINLKGSATLPAYDLSTKSAAKMKTTINNRRRSLSGQDETEIGHLDQVFQTLVQQSHPLKSPRIGGSSPGVQAIGQQDGRTIRRLPSKRPLADQPPPTSTLPTDEDIERLEPPPNVRYVRSMPVSPATPLSTTTGRQAVPAPPATAQPVGYVRNPQVYDFLDVHRRPRSSLHRTDISSKLEQQQQSFQPRRSREREPLSTGDRQKSHRQSDPHRRSASSQSPTKVRTPSDRQTDDNVVKTPRIQEPKVSTPGSAGKRSTSGGPLLRRSYLEESPIVWPKTTGVEKKFDPRNYYYSDSDEL